MSSAAELLASLALAGVPNFAPPVDVVFPLRQFPTQPALADFDADGRPDLLVPGRNSDGLVFVLKGVEGGFALGRGYAVGCQTDWATAADLDGDGDLDVALAARAVPGGVVLLRNRGDGEFDDPVRLSLERETRCVQAVDFDGDGRLDLVLANAASGSLSVLRNLGDMQFAPSSSARLNRWTLGTASPSVVFLPDLDGDGRPDAIDVAGGSGRIDVRRTAAGLLGPERAWDLPSEQGMVVGVALSTMADLNRDGSPELLTVVINGERSNPLYAWSIGGSGEEVVTRRFDGLAQGTAWSAATADLDGDGDADVLTMTVTDGRLCVMENLSTPGGVVQLGPPVPLLSGNFLRHVVPVDVDGDGRLDLAVCDYFDHRVRILRNLGVPTAAPTGAVTPSRAVRASITDPTATAERLLSEGPAIEIAAAPSTRRSAESAAPSACGPSAGDCATVHAGPGCFTTPCCEKVCAILPSCCEVSWDADCVTLVRAECVGLVCPSRGDCSVGHGGPGCEDAACCELVRRLDPTCSSAWDALCVELVPLACGGAAPTIVPPDDAVDEGEPCYRASNQGCSRRSDPVHAPIAAGQRVRGLVTGDGSRDIDAFLLQVDGRRSVRVELRAEFPSQLVLAQGPCAGPLVTLDEALGAPGGLAAIERTLEPGEYRLTVGMAVATRTLRNGQPCLDYDPDLGPPDPPPVPGHFGPVWWMQVDEGPVTIFGDLDASGVVDFGDVAVLLLAMGESDPAYDLDGSGLVDFGDIALLLLVFGG